MKPRNQFIRLFLVIVCLITHSVFADSVSVSLQYEERYHDLLNELRCLVCQNQTIAESDAELAKDLRAEVKKMLEEGASNDDIINFMVNRYGDFVLYKPLVKPKTYLLWFGPFIVLALVLFILIVIIKKQSSSRVTELSSDEQQKLKSYLDQSKDKDSNG